MYDCFQFKGYMNHVNYQSIIVDNIKLICYTSTDIDIYIYRDMRNLEEPESCTKPC